MPHSGTVRVHGESSGLSVRQKSGSGNEADLVIVGAGGSLSMLLEAAVVKVYTITGLIASVVRRGGRFRRVESLDWAGRSVLFRLIIGYRYPSVLSR